MYLSLDHENGIIQSAHKKSERAGKCHKFPVFSVPYKLDGPTGLEGITVLQNPSILPTAGGNPLDITACQKVWNIGFGAACSHAAFPGTAVRQQRFFWESRCSHLPAAGGTAECEFSQDTSEGKSWLDQTDVSRDALSCSFVSPPNHISPAPYVKACYSHRWCQTLLFPAR